jgi:hypothetical protein
MEARESAPQRITLSNFLKRNLHAKLCLERKNPDMARAYKTDVVDNVAIA